MKEVLTLLCFSRIFCKENFFDHQQKLYDEVILKVNPSIGPINSLANISDSTEVFNVNLHLGFIKLIGLNEPNERVDFVIEFIITYRDPRLTWNSSQYGGIETVYPPESMLFKPDLTPTQSQYFEDFREDKQKFTMLRSTGVIEIYTTMFMSSICNVDVRNFPLDQQVCSLRFLSQAFSANVQNLTNSITTPYPFPLSTTGTGEWQVTEMIAVVEDVRPNDFVHIQIARFDIYLKRNFIYYYTLIIIPSFILNVFSIFGLFIKASDMMGKLTVGLTNVMSLSFILGILSSMIPKTKSLPILAIYVLVNLLIVVVCLLISVALPYLPNIFCLKFSPKLRWLDRYCFAMFIGQLLNCLNLIYCSFFRS
ncbi:unnamed protein product [Auanema sp. JU1783]|nr:unnamed protein product [Auanema sp. JU1783]